MIAAMTGKKNHFTALQFAMGKGIGRRPEGRLHGYFLEVFDPVDFIEAAAPDNTDFHIFATGVAANPGGG